MHRDRKGGEWEKGPSELYQQAVLCESFRALKFRKNYEEIRCVSSIPNFLFKTMKVSLSLMTHYFT